MQLKRVNLAEREIDRSRIAPVQEILAGLAADDDVALCFVDGDLEEVVASRPEAGAYRVFVEGERVVEEKIEVRLL